MSITRELNLKITIVFNMNYGNEANLLKFKNVCNYYFKLLIEFIVLIFWPFHITGQKNRLLGVGCWFPKKKKYKVLVLLFNK